MIRKVALLAVFLAPAFCSGQPAERSEVVLHSFRSGDDGRSAYGRVIFDSSGNLFGTTTFGGQFGVGVVFELNPSGNGGWTETLLYNFAGGSDGSQPYGGLIFDSAGNLYGTTYRGGASNKGTVYRLSPPTVPGGTWTEAVLHSFSGGSDGAGPQSDLIFDGVGNLYGTTDHGGLPDGGTVFELMSPASPGGIWSEAVLHSFSDDEGISPRAAVIFDENGVLYGTVANGGVNGNGAVFQLIPPPTTGGPWTENTLYHFQGSDGSGPLSRLVLVEGSLYGTTVIGGASGVGTVFQLTPPAQNGGVWTETVLHSFTCHVDGCYPWAGLIIDQTGAFYGTTQFGGLPSNGGTVFQIKPPVSAGGSWAESVLYSFKYGVNQLSAAGLALGDGGSLYGTTIGAGMRAGMVFEVLPN